MMDLLGKIHLRRGEYACKLRKNVCYVVSRRNKGNQRLARSPKGDREEYIKANPTGTVLKLISKAESSSKEDNADE